uniref:Uncharacterized protein n=1 Tax=Panagrolaimus superbus TaxID=310955 RepID=A0A914YUH0_9BILA
MAAQCAICEKKTSDMRQTGYEGDFVYTTLFFCKDGCTDRNLKLKDTLKRPAPGDGCSGTANAGGCSGGATAGGNMWKFRSSSYVYTACQCHVCSKKTMDMGHVGENGDFTFATLFFCKKTCAARNIELKDILKRPKVESSGIVHSADTNGDAAARKSCYAFSYPRVERKKSDPIVRVEDDAEDDDEATREAHSTPAVTKHVNMVPLMMAPKKHGSKRFYGSDEEEGSPPKKTNFGGISL